MALNIVAAQNLASSTKIVPIWDEITPRWLLQLTPWVDVAAGVFRVNQVTRPAVVTSDHAAGSKLPDTFADYEPHPRDITLTTLQSVITMHSRVPDLYNSPHDQLREQIRLTIEAIKEEKERMFVNAPNFGLLSIAAQKMRVHGAGEALSPDHLDSLLGLVWNRPAFFVAHPRAIACFHQQCNERGLNVETVEMFGVPFSTWRGVPIVPSDKVPVTGKKSLTSVLLLRVGEQNQGVIGLHQQGIGNQHLPSISVRLMGIDQNSISRYLVTAYFSVALLSNSALAVIHDVAV